MILKTKLHGHLYEFKDVCEVMAKANEEKSGGKLAGIAQGKYTVGLQQDCAFRAEAPQEFTVLSFIIVHSVSSVSRRAEKKT